MRRRRHIKIGESNSVFVKVARPVGEGGLNERWAACQVFPTLNVFDNMGDVIAVVLAIRKWRES